MYVHIKINSFAWSSVRFFEVKILQKDQYECINMNMNIFDGLVKGFLNGYR